MENKIYTIEDLREGRVAVVNDGSVEDLFQVLKKAFPKDTIGPGGIYKFYYKDITGNNWWDCSKQTDLPTQSVKVFLKEIEIDEAKEKAKKGVNITLESKSVNDLKLDGLKRQMGTKDTLEDPPFQKHDYSQLLDVDKVLERGIKNSGLNDIPIEELEAHFKDSINPSHYKRLPKETIERIGDNLSIEEPKLFSILLSKEKDRRIVIDQTKKQIDLLVDASKGWHVIVIEQQQDRGIQIIIKS